MGLRALQTWRVSYAAGSVRSGTKLVSREEVYLSPLVRTHSPIFYQYTERSIGETGERISAIVFHDQIVQELQAEFRFINVCDSEVYI